MKATNMMVRYFDKVPDQVRGKKWLVWLSVIILTGFAIAGMGRTKFDMTIEGWFSEDDPTIVGMNEFRAQFGSDDHLYIIYKPRDGEVFSPQSLERVRALRQDLIDRMRAADEGSPLKRIVKVTALTNAPVLTVESDALVSRNLVGRTIPTAREDLDKIVNTAESQRSLPLQYFSKDYEYGAIVVETNFGAIPKGYDALSGEGSDKGADLNADDLIMEFNSGGEEDPITFEPTDLAEYVAFKNAVDVTLDKPRFADYFDYYSVGNPASTEYNLEILQEMGMLYTLMLVIMVIVLWILFRSLSGVLWPTLIVILSAVWTIGFASWLGVTFTAFLILTVFMILVIGIADSMHILSGYEYYCNKGQDHRTAMRSAFRSSAIACFLTTVTTMVAMLALVFTQIVPIQVFGAVTAVGIGLAFLFSIYLLPAMLELWWTPRRRRERIREQRGLGSRTIGKYIPNLALSTQRALQHVFPIVQRFRYAIVVTFAAVMMICLYGTSQVKVDTNIKTQFAEGSQIRENIDIADRDMLGSQRLEIYFDLGEDFALHDPFVLKRMDKLQQTIESDYNDYVVRTLSLVDVTKKSYETLNEDRPEMFIIPETRSEVANTLFIFDISNPTQRRKMVSDDYSEFHITTYLRNAGSYEYTRVFDALKKDVDAAISDVRQAHPDAKASVTGMFTLLMQGSDYLSWTSVYGFGIALLTVTVILLMIFSSLKAGMISVVANAVPVAFTLGLMGLLGVPLDFTTVLIAPIVVGIAVDDTIHFLTHYKQEVTKDGDIKRALIQTIEEVGQAVTFTSLILILGLSVLTFSSSVGNTNVGMYGALAVLLGLICELLLLPALVLITGLDFRKNREALQEASPESSMPTEPAV